MQAQQLTQFPLPPGTWRVDPDAGRVAFTIKTMWGLVNVKGTFDNYEGVLRVTDGTVTGELTLAADSLNTQNKRRDEHLRSADFFDSTRHPHVTFTATDASISDETVLLAGELVVGTSHARLEIPAEVESQAPATATIRASLAVPRADAGLNWNKLRMVQDAARLEIELHLTRIN